MKTYYVVTLRDVPIEVFSHLAAAKHCATERSGTWGDAIIVPCSPNQLELDFETEEPTERDEPAPCCGAV